MYINRLFYVVNFSNFLEFDGHPPNRNNKSMAEAFLENVVSGILIHLDSEALEHTISNIPKESIPYNYLCRPHRMITQLLPAILDNPSIKDKDANKKFRF